ncbi:MAG: hypothetical protein DBX47_01425 [Clostridiales bacterium]|nr:MAG: hypothetical protein DBX47_01425 [Clostridiales bacterium]
MKKVTSFVLSVMLFVCLAVPSFASGDFRGDINYDNKIELADAMLCFQHVAGKVNLNDDTSKTDPRAADINGDGKIELSDAMMVFQFVAGKITQFPEIAA